MVGSKYIPKPNCKKGYVSGARDPYRRERMIALSWQIKDWLGIGFMQPSLKRVSPHPIQFNGACSHDCMLRTAAKTNRHRRN